MCRERSSNRYTPIYWDNSSFFAMYDCTCSQYGSILRRHIWTVTNTLMTRRSLEQSKSAKAPNQAISVSNRCQRYQPANLTPQQARNGFGEKRSGLSSAEVVCRNQRRTPPAQGPDVLHVLMS